MEAAAFQGTCTITKDSERYIGHGLGYLSERTVWRVEYHGGHLDGRRSLERTRKEAREKAVLLGYEPQS